MTSDTRVVQIVDSAGNSCVSVDWGGAFGKGRLALKTVAVSAGAVWAASVAVSIPICAVLVAVSIRIFSRYVTITISGDVGDDGRGVEDDVGAVAGIGEGEEIFLRGVAVKLQTAVSSCLGSKGREAVIGSQGIGL